MPPGSTMGPRKRMLHRRKHRRILPLRPIATLRITLPRPRLHIPHIQHIRLPQPTQELYLGPWTPMLLTMASSPAVVETTQAILRGHRRTLTALHRLPRTPTAVPLQPRHTPLKGILATTTTIFWYIAKPSSTAAPGYYLASDGRRKWISLGPPLRRTDRCDC
jgi:hypothetical protein